MRKQGRNLVFALLLLLVPALANAWTLTTTVQGSSSSGTVYIQDDTTPGDLDITDESTYVVALKGGTTYVQLTGDAKATVELAENIAADVLLNYADIVAGGGPQIGDATYDVTAGPNQILKVAWGQAASAKADVSVEKKAGGTVVLQYNGASSMTGFTGLAFGSTIGIKASPRTDFKVTSIVVTSSGSAGTNVPFDGNAGEAQIVGYKVDGTSIGVKATYQIVETAKPMLSAPLKAVVGKAVTVSANGTTSNAPLTDDSYGFEVTPAGSYTGLSQSGPNLTFIPTGGDVTVTLTIPGTTPLATKDATIKVVSETVAYNNLCLGCHTGSTPAIVNAYQAGIYKDTPCTSCHTGAPHGNFDSTDSGFDHGTGAVTEPSIAGCVQCHSDVETEWKTSNHYNFDSYPYDRGEGSSCEPCHSPGGEVFITDPSTTTVAQVVGCAACHGNDMAVPANVQNTCATCHDRDGHHFSPTLASKVAASKHGDADLTYGNRELCSRCHSYQGSIEFADVIGDADELLASGLSSDTGSYPAGTQNVTCAGCHDPHTGSLRAVPGFDPNGNGVADQFDLCTSCHNYTLDGMLVAGGSTVGDYAGLTAPFYHNTSWYRTIGSTHYDNPATGYGLATNQVEGYVIRANGENPCFDCHGHELRTNSRYAGAPDETDPGKASTIHTDWAKSAHAGGLLTNKLEAYEHIHELTTNAAVQLDYMVFASGAQDAPIGNAWVHYNWDASNRASCQHCHTATGAANFLDAAAAGTTPVANDFSHLAGWNNDTTGSGQNELLYCWGCHSSVETGALRSTGAIKLDYNVNGAAKSLTAPDGNSAACLSCHTGRGNAEAITGSNTPADPSAAAVSSPGTKSHYLAAGLTINQAQVNAGYTFGLNYADKVYFAHNTIGCAECHMSSANSHSFNVVAKNETTEAITAITATNCVTCHDGEHALFVGASQVGTTQLIWNGSAAVETVVTQQMADDAAAELEHEAHGFHAALEVLAEVLTDAGTPPQAGYPYFSGTPANQGHSGAMYNYSYLHHEPGAYAHNRYLAKRLIWDSIDWMDDGSLNNSVPDATAGNTAAAAWLGAVRP